MKVLVSAASKHGATAEIADGIGKALAGRGFDVTIASPEDVDSVDEYGAVVLGSAVYAGHWREEAKELAAKISHRHPAPDVWLFSSGPLGDPLQPDEAPVDVASIVQAIEPHEHRVFAGKVDKSKLGFGEKAIMIAVHAPDGDFRDWDAIAHWAGAIADQLEKK